MDLSAMAAGLWAVLVATLHQLVSAAVIVSPAIAWIWASRERGRAHALETTKATASISDGMATQLNKLVDQVQAERDRAAGLADRYLGELERLRTARYGMEDMISGLRDQALAARTMVHELQRRVGQPETQFDPLPYPGLGPRPPSP